MRKMKMEIQLNRDIREYSEKIYYGMDLRQLLFGVLGLGLGIGAYVLFGVIWNLGSLTATIACTFAVIMPVALGFYKWHGLPLEALVRIWVRAYILTPRFLPYRPENPYLDLIQISQDKGMDRKKKERKRKL